MKGLWLFSAALACVQGILQVLRFIHAQPLLSMMVMHLVILLFMFCASLQSSLVVVKRVAVEPAASRARGCRACRRQRVVRVAVEHVLLDTVDHRLRRCPHSRSLLFLMLWTAGSGGARTYAACASQCC